MSNNPLIPSQAEITAIETMAKYATESTYLSKLGGFAAVFSIAMYAREMNLPIMSSIFGGIRPVLGKIEISPQMMNAMIRKGGHKLKVDCTNERCVIEGTRKDTGETCSVSFSLEDAKRAKINKSGGAWDMYPADMCFARAISRLARRLFPDVIGMAYVEGEIEEMEEENKDDDKDDTIDVKSENSPLNDVLKTLKDDAKRFNERFGGVEDTQYNLMDFVDFISIKGKTTVEDTIRQGLKNDERFIKSYLNWVADCVSKEPKKEELKITQLDMLDANL